MIPLAMALMAGGAYKQYQADKRNQERDDEDRAALVEERNFKRGERDRQVAERTRVADAYAPVGMVDVMQKPDTADNRDVGTPGTDLTATGAKRVGQQTFGPDQMKEAEAAVAAANTPEAQTARASQAMLSMGNVTGAQALRTGARQEKLAGLQLDEAQDKRLRQLFDDSLQPLASHDAIAETISSSNLGGALKVKAVPSADGKSVEYQVVGADGATKPSGYSFENSPRGLLEAKAAMSKLTPVSQKLEYLHKQGTLKRQEAKDAADAKFRADRLALETRQVDAGIANEQARLGFERQRLGMEGARLRLAQAAAEADAKIPPPVKTQFASYDKELNTIGSAMAQAQAKGEFDPNSPGAQALMLRQKELMDKTEALLSPYIATTKAGKAATGKPGDALGIFTDKAGPAPAPGAKPAPAAGAPSPGIGATMADLVRQGVGAVSSAAAGAREQGAQYQLLSNRVREATAGGPPLTPQEAAAARRFGIAIPR